jgi:hypothetical protein
MAISFPAPENAVARQSERFRLLRMPIGRAGRVASLRKPRIATTISPIGTDLVALAPLFGPGASLDHLSSNLH